MGAEPRERPLGHTEAMDERMLHALESQRPAIHGRWEALLRVEPVNTPLGQPEALKHMIDYTLNTLFSGLHAALARRRGAKVHPSSCSAERSHCPCGRNPLLAYFVAGEQALLETLIHVQAGLPDCAESRATAVMELKQVLASVAHREIETFCAVCQYREHPELARHEPGRATHLGTLHAG